jgi:hypothetical protein
MLEVCVARDRLGLEMARKEGKKGINVIIFK